MKRVACTIKIVTIQKSTVFIPHYHLSSVLDHSKPAIFFSLNDLVEVTFKVPGEHQI